MEEQVVQPLAGSGLCLELRDYRGIRYALAGRQGGGDVCVPRECDPARDRERVKLPVVLLSEMLRHLTFHLKPDMIAELVELPAQGGDADVGVRVAGLDA